MIHTLLPTVEKKALRREYHIRFAIVLFFMLSISLVIGLVSQFPTIVKAYRDQQVEEQRSRTVSSDAEKNLASLETELESFKTLLVILSDTGKSQNFSDTVEVITRMRQGVILTAFNVRWEGTTTIDIAIEGKAPTRDALLSFKKRLEETGLIAELPIGELAKSRDVKFTMNITQQI